MLYLKITIKSYEVCFFPSHIRLLGKMAISSENLKLRMFNEITKQDTIYIKHDHRNINQITWLISIGKPGWGKTFSYSCMVLYTFSTVILTT